MTIRNQTIICALVVLTSLSACKSNSTKPATQQANEAVTKTSAKASNQPYWILDPQLKGHLAVVGSAAKQDFGGRQAQYRVAMIKARAELSKIFRTHIESTNEMVQTDAGSNMNTATRATSSEGLQLENALVLEEWTDPDTQELFIWLVLPIK